MFRLIAAAALCCLGTGALRADTIAFTYAGADTTGYGGSSSGAGSITFDGGPGPLSILSLTAFSFSQTTSGVFFLGSSTFNYSLPDLASFSAEYDAGALTALSFRTMAVAGTNGLFYRESFVVNASGQATTHAFDGVLLQSGTVALSPEPSSFLLFGTGAMAMACLAYRRAS